MEEVYPGVETLVNEEDTQDISVPIIQNVNLKKFENFEKNIPQATFTTEFLHAMMNKPELIRNVSYLVILGCFGRSFPSRKNPPYGYLRGQHPSVPYQLF